MSRFGLTVLLVMGTGVPVSVSFAQSGPFGHRHDCCPSCAQPPAVCSCQTVRPVVRTHLERQSCVTYQNVAETRYRQEQVVQRVPTVRYHDVQQTVWVPQTVTKRVARVECEDRVSTRTVPYTVMRTVPQVSTHLVPRQTVQYVRQQHAIAMPPIQAPCTTCGQTAFAPTITAPPVVQSPVVPNPVTLSPIAPTPTASLPAYDSPSGEQLFQQARLPETELTTGPSPDPAFSSSTASAPTEWTTIGQRAETPTPIRQAQAPRLATLPRERPRFTPVPTAAAVWQSNALRR